MKNKTGPLTKPPNAANKKVVPDCKKTYYQFKQHQNGSWNTKPFDKCIDCWRLTRQHQPAKSVGALSTDDNVTHDCAVQQISAFESVDPSKTMSKSELTKTCKTGHPRVKMNIALGCKIISLMAVAGSGAEPNL